MGIALFTRHPGKTKLLDFRPSAMREESAGETFNFLGFTHYWGRTRTGGWSPKLKTEGKSLRRIFLGKVGMQECGLARGKTHKPTAHWGLNLTVNWNQCLEALHPPSGSGRESEQRCRDYG